MGRANPFDRRCAGVLLHPTSLPGNWGNGDIGPEAYRFVDFLAECGQRVWQMLPLGPTHYHGSPYQCLSVHAGNSQLISIDELIGRGWLSAEEASHLFSQGDDIYHYRYQVLEMAFAGFSRHANHDDRSSFDRFIEEQQRWLADYALFQALRKENNGKDWSQWPKKLRDRDTAELRRASTRLKGFISQVYFEQFVFFQQWNNLKDYANRHGILIYGDMPIFVAYDSVDVWAQREYFELDENGIPLVIAGVPPDYFSATGQRWGNPHYRWSLMEQDGFKWWLDRLTMQLKLFDLVRIDHFRGFESYWEIGMEQATAINGRWVKAPGDKLFSVLQQYIDPLPVVAEDLGIITPEVEALRKKYHFPGMKILQFAFSGGPDNPYLPHNHDVDSVVYTGTHDNDTTLGWYHREASGTRAYINQYLGNPADPMPWPLIRCALASVARMAIIPMQDILMLDSEHRMNTPGTIEGNWSWRFDWGQLKPDAKSGLRELTELYGRTR